MKIIGRKPIRGKTAVPGDKSISHRSVILGAIADGTTEVSGFLTGEDCLSTIKCFRALGVDIEHSGTNLLIRGTGSFLPPVEVLDAGNSGTTIRLMAGMLAGQPFASSITGDESLQKRPMKRVVAPLSLMGADIRGDYAPINIKPAKLKGIRYTMPVASAQVKSAILLASLYADGETVIEEPVRSRDHTEIMLNYFGADIQKNSGTIISRGGKLIGKPVNVPGDISSAAFLMAAAVIADGSDIIIENVGVNPTRTGIISALMRMGANISLRNIRSSCGEPVADIEARCSPLKGTVIEGAEIPALIDEIPVIAAAALAAKGETVIKDASELRVKEVDRIKAVADEYNKFYPDEKPIIPTEDGMIIRGGLTPRAAEADSRGDHRMAMSLSVFAHAIEGESVIHNTECADISFPGFYDLLKNLS